MDQEVQGAKGEDEGRIKTAAKEREREREGERDTMTTE